MRFSYDGTTDSVLIFARKQNEQIKGSATISNLVLDISKDGKIVGVEIRKATEFFKTVGLKDSPEEVQSAVFVAKYGSDGFVLFIDFKFKDSEEQKIPIFISAAAPEFAIA